MKDQVINLKGTWLVVFDGRLVRGAEWSERGPAESQLALLQSGYSTLSLEDRVVHNSKVVRP